MDVAFIDDQMLPVDQLGPEYLDRGTFFGDGVYEVIRSYEGRLFALEDHLARFERSLKEIKIDSVDMNQVNARIHRAFEQSGYANARLYFHMTRGSEKRNHVPSPGLKPNFLLTIDELQDASAVKEKGIAVVTHPDWRWKRCDIKSLNLLANVMAKMAAVKAGASEAILVDDRGIITEGAGSAFFAIDGKNGQLITRPLGHEILPSITRSHVMKVAANAGLGVVEKTLTPDDVMRCDELFIAVTTKDVVPVTMFNGQPVGTGKPGQCCKRLIAEFAEMVRA